MWGVAYYPIFATIMIIIYAIKKSSTKTPEHKREDSKRKFKTYLITLIIDVVILLIIYLAVKK
jgi:uncharacterized membrane protein YsdA (DUF1294 family)